MSQIYRLMRAGLTNHDQEDIGVLQMATSSRQRVKLCSSFSCTGVHHGRKRVEKQTRKDQDASICPDCHMHLYIDWIRR